MANIERSLAHIEIVKDITPIEGYDRVALATILGWKVIINKEELHIGDKCVYFEIDSLVNPSDERFSFMEKRKYKVKTLKMCGCVSQGLAMPLSQFPELGDLEVGTDVTEKLKVTYYNPDDRQRKSSSTKIKDKSNILYKLYPNLFKKKFFKWLMKKKLGKKLIFFVFGRKIHYVEMKSRFPLKIVKTDETRCLVANTKVMTENGQERIGMIVNSKMDVLVKTYNFNNNSFEYKKIIDYQRLDKEPIIKITWSKSISPNKIVNFTSNNSNSISCTMDHRLLTNNGYKKASDITLDDKLMMVEECYTEDAMKLFYGFSIGDGCLLIDKRSQGTNGRIAFTHGKKQENYLKEKLRLLSVKNDNLYEFRGGYENNALVRGCTPADKNFTRLLFEDEAIKNGKLFRSEKFCKRLTPVSLAFWYLDDGTIRHKDDGLSPTIEFSTHSETEEEVRNLMRTLQRFGIESTRYSAYRNSKFIGYTIRLNADDTYHFLDLIKNYIPYSMRWKTISKFADVEYCLENVHYEKTEMFIPATIISIEETEPQYVYDITVEGNHNFISNGILSHNCENIPFILEGEKNKSKCYSVTEKLDGTSTTFFLEKYRGKYEFGVCSRNVRQLDPYQETYFTTTSGLVQNVYWEMAFKYSIKDKLIDIAEKTGAKFLYLQGETIGQKIQGNPYKLNDRQFYAFNLVIDDKRYENYELFKVCDKYDIPHVPLIFMGCFLPNTMEELKEVATGNSQINRNVLREGLVYREFGNSQFSFKNVSREYLLKHS